MDHLHLVTILGYIISLDKSTSSCLSVNSRDRFRLNTGLNF